MKIKEEESDCCELLREKIFDNLKKKISFHRMKEKFR